MKSAFITGVTGQDGSYLAELLLAKGYTVFGLQRRSSTSNSERIDHMYDNPRYKNFVTIYGDLSDSSNLSTIIAKLKPDEIYNLGAQSHVKVSFQVPEYTANVTALGALRLLEIVRQVSPKTKYYQASSSEMFGKVQTHDKLTETSLFQPQSPYGLAKVFAYHITRMYRESYGLFATNGILFNHESPRRGITFVTRKITLGLARVKFGLQQHLSLGNLDAMRDWGYAKDYVEGIYSMLQHKNPDDFILATGETHSVREFITVAASLVGLPLTWKGKGMREKGIDKKSGKVVVTIDADYFRPQDVAYLLGDASKAKKLLKWKPKTSFKKLVELMVKHDYDVVAREVKTGKKIVVKTLPIIS